MTHCDQHYLKRNYSETHLLHSFINSSTNLFQTIYPQHPVLLHLMCYYWPFQKNSLWNKREKKNSSYVNICPKYAKLLRKKNSKGYINFPLSVKSEWEFISFSINFKVSKNAIFKMFSWLQFEYLSYFISLYIYFLYIVTGNLWCSLRDRDGFLPPKLSFSLTFSFWQFLSGTVHSKHSFSSIIIATSIIYYN